MNTPQLLTHTETCHRKGWWSRLWEPQRLNSNRIVHEAIRTALLAPGGQQHGETAGDAVMQFGSDRGLETSAHRIYDAVCHLACLADILVSAIRKPDDKPWLTPEPLQNWKTDCLMSPDGNSLRRIVLVSNWTDARHYSECRSWFSLGEVCHYNLPLQMCVFVVGQERNGKRSSPWTMGYRHPQNHQLRFRRRSSGAREEGHEFKSSWEKIWREDYAEISRDTWLQSMLTDDVLPEVCFKVDIAVPAEIHRQRIVDMAKRKLDRIYGLKNKPEANLSSCDWPIPCVFRGCCHVLPELEPNKNSGFLRLDAIDCPHPISALLRGPVNHTISEQ